MLMLCIDLFFKLIVIHLCIIIYTYNLINKIKNHKNQVFKVHGFSLYSTFLCIFCTYICGHQLLCIVDAQHSDFPLADKRVIIRIAGYQQHL